MSRIFREDVLAGQVALVTGGGTGIGAAIARELGSMGADVVIASRKASHIEPAAAGLSRELGREVKGLLCDVRDRDAVAACVRDALGWKGRIDLLVNNGGGQFFTPAEAISPKGWDAVIQTNLTGQWNLTHAVASAWMLEHGGKIVNITMMTARGFPGMAHSAAARAGVESLTKTLAVEWAGRGIRLNTVAPGYIASSGLDHYPDGRNLARRMQSCVPFKRLGTSEEIAWWVAMLASPAGDYVTGQILTVDGGKTLWGDYWIIPDPEPLPEVDIPKEPWEE